MGQGHGPWKTRTGLPLRRTERLKDRSKTLGGFLRKEQGRSERFVDGKQEDKKEENQRLKAYSFSAAMIALMSSFGEQSLLRHLHAPAPWSSR